MMEDQDAYRQADQENHGCSADGAGDGAGAARTDSPEPVEGAEQDAFREPAGGGEGLNYADLLNSVQNQLMAAGQQQAFAGMVGQQGLTAYSTWPSSYSISAIVRMGSGNISIRIGGGGAGMPIEPSSLEDGGVVVGEVEGWRVWKSAEDGLHSVSMDTLWVPGETMEGDPEAMHQGVYAFKTRNQLHASGMAHFTLTPDDMFGWPYVWGRVKMWGNIIEHENGYRAQYAKITHIDGGCGPDVLKLRQIYGVDGEELPQSGLLIKVADTVFRPRFDAFVCFCAAIATIAAISFLSIAITWIW